MPYPGRSDSKLTRVLVIILSLFILLLVIVQWLVNTRESACADYCRLMGSPHYAYRGFSGSGKSLRADSCHCLSSADLASDEPKTDIGKK